MKCEFCGHALGTNDAYCHNCGRLITKAQMAFRKEFNGANNAYAKRLNELNKQKYLYNTEERVNTTSKKKVALLILIILLLIVLFAIIKNAT